MNRLADITQLKNDLANQAKKAQQEQERNRLKTPVELVDELAKTWDVEDRPLTTTFDTIDQLLRCKLRGKLGVFVGKGGCKKSLFAQQISRANAVYGYRTIYSTMEMPATQLVERLIDMTFTDQDNNFYGMNASYFLEREYRSQPQIIKDRVSQGLKSTFGDKFMISQQSNMKAEDYRKLIIDHNNKYDQPLSVLIVDGLSMMGGKGSETEDYTTNSKELKDLANEFNIFIALICHVTKQCKKHTRNTSDFIRGSEKILDNCDFIVQMSLCQDKDTVTKEGDSEYLQDIGYIRFYDKRGVGVTKNLIYLFDKQKLRLTESTLSPKDFEIEDKPMTKF